MKILNDAVRLRLRSYARMTVPPTLALLFFAPMVAAKAQPADKPAEKTDDSKPITEGYRTLYLTNLTQQREANDLVTDMRNMIPRARVYYVESQNAISLRATPEDFQIAQRILADIDRTRRVYRVTYTITNIDGGKRTGEQHFSLIVASGGKTGLKQGNRVPIATGTYTKDSPSSEVQYQYLDVGLNIESSLEGERLRTKIEQSSVADEKSGLGGQDPVISQITLEGLSTLAQGKPLILGSLDIPGTARRQEIAVESELVP
jgi:type II secretory pathway component GspD/PulD (secretin)